MLILPKENLYQSSSIIKISLAEWLSCMRSGYLVCGVVILIRYLVCIVWLYSYHFIANSTSYLTAAGFSDVFFSATVNITD